MKTRKFSFSGFVGILIPMLNLNRNTFLGYLVSFPSPPLPHIIRKLVFLFGLLPVRISGSGVVAGVVAAVVVVAAVAPNQPLVWYQEIIAGN